MALVKNKILSNLDQISYWRIVKINHVAKDGTDVIVGGFSSKEVSDQVGDLGIKDIANLHFDISKDDFCNGNPYQIAYELIKTPVFDKEGNQINWFADAEDLI